MYNIPWRHSAKHHTAFNHCSRMNHCQLYIWRQVHGKTWPNITDKCVTPTSDQWQSSVSEKPFYHPLPVSLRSLPSSATSVPTVYRSHRLTCIIHRDTVKQRWLVTRASCSRKLSLYDKKLSKKRFINFLINYRNITVILPALQTLSCTHLYLSGHSSVMIKFPDLCPDISSEHLQSIDPCNGSNRKRNEC